MMKKRSAVSSDAARPGMRGGVGAGTAMGLVTTAGLVLFVAGRRKANQSDTAQEVVGVNTSSNTKLTLDAGEAVVATTVGSQSLEGELTAKFWVSVLSNTFAGLITAWVIFAVGSTVAIAAQGGPSVRIRWGDAMATAGLCVGLGLTLMLAAWTVVALLRPASDNPPSFRWVAAVIVVGGFTTSCWLFVPDAPGAVGFIVTLAVTLALAIFGGLLRLNGPAHSNPRMGRALQWWSLLLAVVGIVISGVSIGSIFSLVLTGSLPNG